MAVGIGVDGARPQRLLRQRHGVEIGVVVGRQDAHRAGLHGVGDDMQITSERRAEPARRRPGIGNARPRDAPRRMAAAAARAVRIAERQSHLEGEIGAQEIDEIGAIGSQHHRHFVFAGAEIIEQNVARAVAQHRIERRPRRLGIERRVEQLFDPRGIEIFRRAVPVVAQRPEAPRRRRRRRRFCRADRDLARDRAAAGQETAAARQLRAPRPRRRRRHLGEPDIRRPVEPRPRRRRDGTVRPNQRQFPVGRLLHARQ